jgi:hypothetical protein
MSVYVGIDVHRKRSQVAVVAGDGQVQLNRNVVSGSEPMLRLIGGLPAGTPVAFEAAYGRGWLVELLEDYGFDPHMVHPLRCLCDDRHVQAAAFTGVPAVSAACRTGECPYGSCRWASGRLGVGGRRAQGFDNA